jgi:hypothetical protein
LTASDPVEAFVMGSSLIALTGYAGHAAYTGSNAFLDALTASRRRRGKPALTVDWCGIREMGMAARYLAGATSGHAGKDDVGPRARRGRAEVAMMIPEVRQRLTAKPADAPPEPGIAPARWPRSGPRFRATTWEATRSPAPASSGKWSASSGIP